MNVLRLMQQIDRRVLYMLLILSTTLPFFANFNRPLTISAPTRRLYDTIENLPPHAFVLLGVEWSASSRGENGAQTEVLVRHLLRKRARFAILAFDPQAKTLAQRITEQVQNEYNAHGANIKEGTDWVNWGYRPLGNMVNFLKAFVQDVPKTVETDVHDAPVAGLPVMEGIHSAHDINLILDINPTNSYTAYIQFVQGPFKIPMGLAPTAVMAAEGFNYLDSGQLVGMLQGLQGAIEYEQLLHTAGRATRASRSLSVSHLLIIALIALGNIAMLLERRQKAAMGGAR